MQSIALYDDVLIKKSTTPGIRLFTNLPNLPHDRNNLVYQVAEDLIKKYEIDSGVLIKLFKRIPVSAGLGGGSSDCATTLLGMKKLFKLPITVYQSFNICKQYGADVPFCFMGGTALAENIGTSLKRLPDHLVTVVLVVVPKFFLSSTKIYKLFDRNFKPKAKNDYRTQKLITGLKMNNQKKIAASFFNDLEDTSNSLCSSIKAIKKVMKDSGALGTNMSGSGPSVFGYYQNFAAAQKSAKIVSKDFPDSTIFITHTC
jgi:4-diphosphocytidyl-2-C-methyl-D-erythritol kinase